MIKGTQSRILDPTVHYVHPDFKIPKPEEVEASKGDVIFHWGGVKIIRLSDKVAVKHGPSVRLKEAETLKYLSDVSVSLPFPKLFASYTCAPVQIDPDDPDSLHTYIFMEYVPGEALDKVWSTLDAATKIAICRELGNVVEELRALPAPSYVGSVNEGPVLDNVVEQVESKGPFRSVADFHEALAKSYARIHKGQIFRFVQGLLDAGKQHKVVFTHSDLRQANIIVQNGRITGVIDWEMAGWYPEYWEFAKVFTNYGFQNDWGNNMLNVLQPYYAEASAHGYVSQYLW